MDKPEIISEQPHESTPEEMSPESRCQLSRESLAERPGMEGCIRIPDRRLPLGMPFSAQNVGRKRQIPIASTLVGRAHGMLAPHKGALQLNS